jgi:hypothetical protein
MAGAGAQGGAEGDAARDLVAPGLSAEGPPPLRGRALARADAGEDERPLALISSVPSDAHRDERRLAALLRDHDADFAIEGGQHAREPLDGVAPERARRWLDRSGWATSRMRAASRWLKRAHR